MINTVYTALSNTGNTASLHIYSTSNSSQEMRVVNNANTYADSGVILTLSKQAISLGLVSGAARTLTSTSTTSVLKVGNCGATVTELQKNLTKLGYDTKGTDGIFGNNTKNAVLSFQRAHNLTADGIVGAGTQSAIAKALNYHNKGILVLGSRGAAVTELQKNLTKLGYDTKGTEGIFGVGTKNAVIAFQRAHGLSPDGMVGNDTKKAISEEIAKIAIKPVTTPEEETKSNGTIRNVTLEKYNNKVNEANAKYVWDELIKAGFTKEAAAGIMGNLDAESAFKTDWSGDQGSVGIAQWRGTRKENLVKYAKENNGSETDIRIQTGFLIHQDLVARIGSSGVEKLKRMNDYIDATDYFCDKVESPSSYKNKSAWENGKYGPNYAQHGGTYQIKWERYTWSDQAQKYLLDLGKRRAAADYWYKKFA